MALSDADHSRDDEPKARAHWTRRRVLRSLSVAGTALLAAACGPVSPAQQAPAPPTREPIRPAGAPTQAAAAAGERQAAPDGDWDRTLAAAKQEGKLAIAVPIGVGFRNALDAFQSAFPGLTVESRQFSAMGQAVPILRQERQAGVFTWDIFMCPSVIALDQMRPEGMLDPLRPLIVRSGILDDAVWENGLDTGWLDKAKSLGYGPTLDVSGFLIVNPDIAPEATDIKSVHELNDPRWQGKILFPDVRLGQTYGPLNSVRMLYGEDVLRKLLVEQRPSFTQDRRQIAEAVVRGTIPIGLGVGEELLKEFWDQGVGRNVQFVDCDGLSYLTFGNAVWVMNQAPHPNAAKVFANWILSSEGQTAWTKEVFVNSRRTDVPRVAPQSAPKSGRKYVYSGPEDFNVEYDTTRKMLDEMVASRA